MYFRGLNRKRLGVMRRLEQFQQPRVVNFPPVTVDHSVFQQVVQFQRYIFCGNSGFCGKQQDKTLESDFTSEKNRFFIIRVRLVFCREQKNQINDLMKVS
ncbi:MAG: hypothetical protein ACI8V2_000607 [Candidatus Latescibacterota bacterium]|jgi:hypothetical protein